MSDHTSHFLAADAYQILTSELAVFRQLSFSELAQFIGPPQVRRVRASDSTMYATQITIRMRSTGDIIVEGWIAVDDGGPMRRLDDHFIVSPAG